MHNHTPKDYDNPFEKIVHQQPTTNLGDQEQFVFYRDEHITAFISSKQWPNNPGNVLIIPNEVYENLYDIPDELLVRIHIFSKRVAIAMKKTYGCDGVSIRQHNEPAGNQEVWHYHLHVFPRYEDDFLYTLHKYGKAADDTIRLEYTQKLRDYFANNQ